MNLTFQSCALLTPLLVHLLSLLFFLCSLPLLLFPVSPLLAWFSQVSQMPLAVLSHTSSKTLLLNHIMEQSCSCSHCHPLTLPRVRRAWSNLLTPWIKPLHLRCLFCHGGSYVPQLHPQISPASSCFAWYFVLETRKVTNTEAMPLFRMDPAL